MKGVFGLHNARDLLKKLEADHARVHSDPTDAFAAYDFVVGAWHLLEWALPGDTNASAREALIAANPMLRVCEHLAVGAKHFQPNSARHNSVAGDETGGAWAKGAWAPDAWANGTWQKWITIQLDGAAASKCGAEITILELADAMLAFWKQQLP
jgi:hypothetical protein